ncbi:MAG: hypothetical protein Q9182_000866 [Xanthomendoza sp. 2 TL-2023]
MSVQHSESFVRGEDDNATCAREAETRRCDEESEFDTQNVKRIVGEIEKVLEKTQSHAERREKLKEMSDTINELAKENPGSSCGKKCSEVMAAWVERENNMPLPPPKPRRKSSMGSACSLPPPPAYPYRGPHIEGTSFRGGPHVEGTFPNIIRNSWLRCREFDGRVEILNRLKASGTLFIDEKPSSSTSVDECEANINRISGTEDRGKEGKIDVLDWIETSANLSIHDNSGSLRCVGGGDINDIRECGSEDRAEDVRPKFLNKC